MTGCKLIFKLSMALLITVLAAAPLLAIGDFIGSGGSGGSGIYTTPNDIGFAQSILESEKYLSHGDYSHGRRGRATRAAIRSFQGDHTLHPTGWIDFETMALLTSHGSGDRLVRRAERIETATPSPVVVAAARPAPPPPVSSPPSAQEKAESSPASAPPPPRGEADLNRMPETAGAVPLMVLTGGILVAVGLLLILKRGV